MVCGLPCCFSYAAQRHDRSGAAIRDYCRRVPPLYPLTRAHEVDSATRWGRHLAAAADSIFAQFGSGPRRSLRRSAERPARAAWAALRLLAAVAIGATMELGRSWRTLLMMLLLRPRGAGELRGHRQQAALKDQTRLPKCGCNARATASQLRQWSRPPWMRSNGGAASLPQSA